MVHAEAADPSFRNDVLSGLSGRPKQLSPKYFYDAAGAGLFDAICTTPEYYITRTEENMLRQLAPELPDYLGTGGLVVEPGSGNSRKVRLLLEAIQPEVYMPVDICRGYLERAVKTLIAEYPRLKVRAVQADFARLSALPFVPSNLHRVMFFPGSTIGNFEPAAAGNLLRRMRMLLGRGANLLVGVDLKKETRRLESAYNDSAGYTAAFNRNILARINRELGGDFEPDAFRHHAFYNENQGRIEMHLVSEREQTVRIGERAFHFFAGESIHTENSYKYTLNQFRLLASDNGFIPVTCWTDKEDVFSIHALKAV